jgi:hypothetical protein
MSDPFFKSYYNFMIRKLSRDFRLAVVRSAESLQICRMEKGAAAAAGFHLQT